MRMAQDGELHALRYVMLELYGVRADLGDQKRLCRLMRLSSLVLAY
jgi:hypothetical protein